MDNFLKVFMKAGNNPNLSFGLDGLDGLGLGRDNTRQSKLLGQYGGPGTGPAPAPHGLKFAIPNLGQLKNGELDSIL